MPQRRDLVVLQGEAVDVDIEHQVRPQPLPDLRDREPVEFWRSRLQPEDLSVRDSPLGDSMLHELLVQPLRQRSLDLFVAHWTQQIVHKHENLLALGWAIESFDLLGWAEDVHRPTDHRPAPAQDHAPNQRNHHRQQKDSVCAFHHSIGTLCL